MSNDNRIDSPMSPLQIALVAELVKVVQRDRFASLAPYEVAEAFGSAMAVVLRDRVKDKKQPGA